MTKQIDHGSLDKALQDIANNGNELHLVSQAPAVYADVAAHSLGHVALNLGAGNGAYIIQNGAVSGRRLTVAQQTVPGTAAGTATHAVIVDTVNSAIKQITTAPNYNMQVGVNQTVPSFDAWEIEIRPDAKKKGSGHERNAFGGEPMISLLWAAEAVPALAPGQHIVDLSQANMIAGAMVGGFGVTAVFVFIGFLLFKSGLRFHFGLPPATSPLPAVAVICNDPSKCPGHGTLETKQGANDKAVDILFEKFKGLETKMDEGFTKVQEGQQAIVLALAGKGIKVAPVK